MQSVQFRTAIPFRLNLSGAVQSSRFKSWKRHLSTLPAEFAEASVARVSSSGKAALARKKRLRSPRFVPSAAHTPIDLLKVTCSNCGTVLVGSHYYASEAYHGGLCWRESDHSPGFSTGPFAADLSIISKAANSWDWCLGSVCT